MILVQILNFADIHKYGIAKHVIVNVSILRPVYFPIDGILVNVPAKYVLNNPVLSLKYGIASNVSVCAINKRFVFILKFGIKKNVSV